VQEQFLNRNLPNKAVGKTKAVEGQFQFTTDGQPTAQVLTMTVDLRTLTSDSGRRDQAIRSRWLESDTYPFATFTSTEVQNAPTSYTEGQEVAFKLLGNMTIHNTTKPVTFDVRGKLQGDTVTGTATTFLMMRDFGFEPPSIASVLTVQDGVTVTVNFTAKEGSNNSA
jgi:polyisoprenoid-binding protein YceI